MTDHSHIADERVGIGEDEDGSLEDGPAKNSNLGILDAAAWRRGGRSPPISGSLGFTPGRGLAWLHVVPDNQGGKSAIKLTRDGLRLQLFRL